LSKFVGESEKGVREVFKKARQASPCILFFDEFDAIASTRSSSDDGSGVAKRVISQILTELDGIEDLKGVLVIAATNRRDMLDPALLRPGRFDLLLEIPPPDLDGRTEIFAIHLKNRPIGDGVVPRELAGETEGMTGADIDSICRRAARMTVREFLSSHPDGQGFEALVIGRKSLLDAIRETRDTREPMGRPT
jgi:transitional endoplasmic reticulum ATPase